MFKAFINFLKNPSNIDCILPNMGYSANYVLNVDDQKQVDLLFDAMGECF